MTDVRTDLQKKSDALKAKMLQDLVPVVLTEPMGFVLAGAIFWTLPRKEKS